MPCDDVREFLIDLGLNEPTRRRAAEALAHLEACGGCRAALRDYDTIAATLREAAALPAEEAEWALSNGPAESWAAIEKRIELTVPPAGSGALPIFRSLRICGAVAAALLLAAGSFFAGRSASPSRGSGNPSLAFTILPGPTATEVATQVRAFQEINADFDGRLPWIVLARGQRDVDHARPTQFKPGSRGEKLLVVRLKLYRGAEVISDADLVIVAGQTADLAVPTSAGASLRYRVVTSKSAPGSVGLRAEMRSAGDDEPQAALATDLQLRPDRATTAGQLVTPAGAFDLAVSYGTPL